MNASMGQILDYLNRARIRCRTARLPSFLAYYLDLLAVS